jgi:hypothetical protein
VQAPVARLAAHRLGIDLDAAEALFFVHNWPDNIQTAYDRTEGKPILKVSAKRYQLVVQRIQHWIDHEAM